MGNRADVATVNTVPMNYRSGGVAYLVETPAGALYLFHFDLNINLSFVKSTDGGLTWSGQTTVFVGTLESFSVWYDRWSGISAGLIHLAYTETVGHDTLYRTVNTESSDALSTQTTIFAGASVAGLDGHLTICRARGGNVYCKTMIDAGVEGGFFRLLNANVPNGAWDAARTINEALATLDQCILVPGFAADNQNMMLIFWDASANEISRQVYDDSANSWAETSISTGMTDASVSTGTFNFSATVDLTNSRIVLVAWTQEDLLNANLLGWTVTESAITAFTTPVVLNSTDDQGRCAITIEPATSKWTVFYLGASDGSETFRTAVNLYRKCSMDAGVTWGPETKLSQYTRDIAQLYTCPRSLFDYKAVYWVNLSTDGLFVNVPTLRPRAAHQMFGG